MKVVCYELSINRVYISILIVVSYCKAIINAMCIPFKGSYAGVCKTFLCKVKYISKQNLNIYIYTFIYIYIYICIPR